MLRASLRLSQKREVEQPAARRGGAVGRLSQLGVLTFLAEHLQRPLACVTTPEVGSFHTFSFEGPMSFVFLRSAAAGGRRHRAEVGALLICFHLAGLQRSIAVVTTPEVGP